MSKKYFLYLDDLRDPFKETKWPDHIYTLQTVIVRNYNEFVKGITEKGLPDTVSFDFDLAPEHYKQGERSHFTSIDGYEKLSVRNGLDCAKWLVNYCETHQEKLPVFYSHSMNPVGRKNILDLLNKYKEKQDAKN